MGLPEEAILPAATQGKNAHRWKGVWISLVIIRDGVAARKAIGRSKLVVHADVALIKLLLQFIGDNSAACIARDKVRMRHVLQQKERMRRDERRRNLIEDPAVRDLLARGGVDDLCTERSEVTTPFRIIGHNAIEVLSLGKQRALHVDKEECLVLPDRTTYGKPKLIAMQRLVAFMTSCRRKKEVILRVQGIVAKELIQGPMKLIPLFSVALMMVGLWP